VTGTGGSTTPPPPPTDPTPPTVSLTAPANGATVSNTVSVSANASDNTAVAGVQFLLDGANLQTEDTTAPYSISWNTTTATNGTHTLTARARDAAGNTTTAPAVTVTVSNKFTLGQLVRVFTGGPNLNVRSCAGTTCSIVGTQPNGAQGTITGGPVFASSLNWWQVDFATGADGWAAEDYLVAASGALTPSMERLTLRATRPSGQGTVAGVQWFVDGQPFGAEDTSSPYDLQLTLSLLSAGSHSVFARFRTSTGTTEDTETFTFSSSGAVAAAETPNATLAVIPEPAESASRESQIASIAQALEAAKAALMKLLGQ
jgi:uncharacterized protein YraI